jgi:G-patch domain/R3H domain
MDGDVMRDWLKGTQLDVDDTGALEAMASMSLVDVDDGDSYFADVAHGDSYFADVAHGDSSSDDPDSCFSSDSSDFGIFVDDDVDCDDYDDDDDDEEEEQDDGVGFIRWNVGAKHRNDVAVQRRLMGSFSDDNVSRRAKTLQRREMFKEKNRERLEARRRKRQADVVGGQTTKKKQKKNHGVDLIQVSVVMKGLAREGGSDEWAMPPMGNRERWLVHRMAALFKLESVSLGQGRKRFTVLQRTKASCAPDDQVLRKFLAKPLREASEKRAAALQSLPSLASQRQRANNNKQKKQKKLTRKQRNTAAKIEDDPAAVQHPSQAPRIADDNVGSRLLRQIGWTENTGLGSQRDGIVEPLRAMGNRRRSGLGAD